MSDGSEFQVCGAATENARRANSVPVLAADSSGASETSRLASLKSRLVPAYPGCPQKRPLNGCLLSAMPTSAQLRSSLTDVLQNPLRMPQLNFLKLGVLRATSCRLSSVEAVKAKHHA